MFIYLCYVNTLCGSTDVLLLLQINIHNFLTLNENDAVSWIILDTLPVTRFAKSTMLSHKITIIIHIYVLVTATRPKLIYTATYENFLGFINLKFMICVDIID